MDPPFTSVLTDEASMIKYLAYGAHAGAAKSLSVCKSDDPATRLTLLHYVTLSPQNNDTILLRIFRIEICHVECKEFERLEQ